ncbi:hypothetical protein HUT10_08080 [Amycolatopsis sp. Hca4]|nr:hypothetical protein HUT10_08080 [Amycolatopsis sp. Hca4]
MSPIATLLSLPIVTVYWMASPASWTPSALLSMTAEAVLVTVSAIGSMVTLPPPSLPALS